MKRNILVLQELSLLEGILKISYWFQQFICLAVYLNNRSKFQESSKYILTGSRIKDLKYSLYSGQYVGSSAMVDNLWAHVSLWSMKASAAASPYKHAGDNSLSKVWTPGTGLSTSDEEGRKEYCSLMCWVWTEVRFCTPFDRQPPPRKLPSAAHDWCCGSLLPHSHSHT